MAGPSERDLAELQAQVDELNAQLDDWKSMAKSAQEQAHRYIAMMDAIAETLGEEGSELTRSRLQALVGDLRDQLQMRQVVKTSLERQGDELRRTVAVGIVNHILGDVAAGLNEPSRARLSEQYESHWLGWIAEHLRALTSAP